MYTYQQNMKRAIRGQINEVITQVAYKKAELGFITRSEADKELDRLRKELDAQLDQPKYLIPLFALSLDMSNMTEENIEQTARNQHAATLDNQDPSPEEEPDA